MRQDTTQLPPNQSRRLKVLVGLLILVVAVIAVIIVVGSRIVTSLYPPTATVQITDHGFQPANFQVRVGTKVTWNNTGAKLHQIASNPYPADTSLPGLSSPGLESGQSYSYTFTKTGKIGYHDQQNPTSLLGTVNVTR